MDERLILSSGFIAVTVVVHRGTGERVGETYRRQPMIVPTVIEI